jgi:uncharacterized protein YqeY
MVGFIFRMVHQSSIILNQKNMTIKELIQSDFISALKNKDEIAKTALSGIKSKITEAEKANGNKELSDDDVIKVINKAIKQREESMKIYSEAGRIELATKEADEVIVLKKYMPVQMTEEEIEIAVREIIQSLDGVVTNANALVGKTMGTFNKNYQGRADLTIVSSIIKKIVG